MLGICRQICLPAYFASYQNSNLPTDGHISRRSTHSLSLYIWSRVKNARPQRRQDQRRDKDGRNPHVDLTHSLRVKLSLGSDVTELACRSTGRCLVRSALGTNNPMALCDVAFLERNLRELVNSTSDLETNKTVFDSLSQGDRLDVIALCRDLYCETIYGLTKRAHSCYMTGRETAILAPASTPVEVVEDRARSTLTLIRDYTRLQRTKQGIWKHTLPRELASLRDQLEELLKRKKDQRAWRNLCRSSSSLSSQNALSSQNVSSPSVHLEPRTPFFQ